MLVSKLEFAIGRTDCN